MAPKMKTGQARWLRAIDREHADNHWRWMGRRDKETDVPIFHRNKEWRPAEEFGWELYRQPPGPGRDNPGYYAHRTCVLRECMNPDHWELRFKPLPADGEQPYYERFYAPHNSHTRYLRRLTPSDIAQIKKAKEERFSVEEISERFGISRMTVYRILKGTHRPRMTGDDKRKAEFDAKIKQPNTTPTTPEYDDYNPVADDDDEYAQKPQPFDPNYNPNDDPNLVDKDAYPIADNDPWNGWVPEKIEETDEIRAKFGLPPKNPTPPA